MKKRLALTNGVAECCPLKAGPDRFDIGYTWAGQDLR